METFTGSSFTTESVCTITGIIFLPETTHSRARRLSNDFADRAAWAIENGYLLTAMWCAEAADLLASSGDSPQ